MCLLAHKTTQVQIEILFTSLKLIGLNYTFKDQFSPLSTLLSPHLRISRIWEDKQNGKMLSGCKQSV